MTASIKAVRGLGWDGTANIRELLINVVRKNKPKDAERLEPKGTVVGTEAESSSVVDTITTGGISRA